MSNILITAGGTGGHMFPALVVSEQLVAQGHEVQFITDTRGAKFLPKNCSCTVYNLSNLGNRTGLALPLAVFQMIKLLFSCFRRFIQDCPDRVIGFGGYTTYPVLFMARVFMVPYYIHEQNSVMGKVNRWFSRGASRVMTSFPHTTYANDNACCTGLPVRPELILLSERIPYEAPTNHFNLLVLGGSQGARIFSKVLPEALKLLPQSILNSLNITQQCREEDLRQVRHTYKELGVTARLETFFEHMAAEYTHAHLVISRAGASTMAELALMGRPAIFVPYANAMDDHQTRNAAYAVSANAAWSIPENNFKPEILADLLTELAVNTTKLVKAAEAMKSLSRAGAVQDIARIVAGQEG